MIYFKQDLVNKTLKEIKEANDLMDILNDLNKIEQTNFLVRQYGDLQAARNLDIELRNKYILINKMLEVGTALHSITNSITNVTGSQTEREIDEIEWLRQDYYGILCDTAIKKGLIQQIEQFIDRVD